MELTPYLHFQGDCRAAMEAYAVIMGDGDLQLMTYADMPDAPAGAPGADRVMHGYLPIEGGRGLMASDYPPGQAGEPQAGVSVMVGPATAERAEEIFTALADGGEVIQPFGPTFFSPGFGMVRDRFGTSWIIAADAA